MNRNPFVAMAMVAALMSQTPFERGARSARRKIKQANAAGVRYKPNGKRECARRMRQIAAGQLTEIERAGAGAGMIRPPIIRLHTDEIIVDSFAGGGGASLGIEMALGRSPDIAINHDAEALRMHQVNHPTSRHYCEDAWAVDPIEACGGRRVGLMWLSPDCFPAGTLVLTGRGYMPIEQIEVGDAVLTHKGRWRHVTEVSSTKRPLMTVKGHGHPGLPVSPEHPFYARTHQRSEPGWLPARVLERGEYWATPVKFPSRSPEPVPGRGMSADARLMWLAGRYVGDGWTRITAARAEVVITCGKHEAARLRETLAQWPRAGLRAGADELAWSERPTATAYQFATNHRGLVQWLREHFGHRAESKGVPAWALGMETALRQALLDGYLSADGHRAAMFVECRTVSKTLAYGVKALAASLGHTVTVYSGKNTQEIAGRPVRARDYFLLRWRHSVDKAHRQTFRSGCLEWAPIREVGPRSIHTHRVYNIGVADDESYVVEGIVVHNCKHFSKAKGGKPVEKKIRGLAWVAVKWAKAVKPRVIVLENVEEFADWGPLLEDGRPCPVRKGLTFRRFVRQLSKCGYTVDFQELVAADYGAPTTRKRLFLIARCDGEQIVWPEPTHGKGRASAWRTAAECIEWALPCPSIFERVRPLAENTLRRIARGIRKYVIDAAEPFIVPVLHAGDARTHSIDNPMPTVTGAHRGEHALVTPFISKMREGSIGTGIDEPLHTITAGGQQARPGTGNAMALIAPTLVKNLTNNTGGPVTAPLSTTLTGNHHYLVGSTLIQTGYGERHGQAPRVPGLDKPLGTVVGGGQKHALVAAHLSPFNGIKGNETRGSSPAEPLRTQTGDPKHALVSAFLAKHYGDRGQRPGSPMDEPVATITACDHNALVASHLTKFKGTCRDGQPLTTPLHTVQAGGFHYAEVRAFLLKFYGTDQDPRLREPMHTVTSKDRFGLVTVAGEQYAIADIGMRMLQPRELFRAQGFPDSYRIEHDVDGKPFTKSAQVRMCGNSVCPPVAAAILRAQFEEQALEVVA